MISRAFVRLLATAAGCLAAGCGGDLGPLEEGAVDAESAAAVATTGSAIPLATCHSGLDLTVHTLGDRLSVLTLQTYRFDHLRGAAIPVRAEKYTRLVEKAHVAEPGARLTLVLAPSKRAEGTKQIRKVSLYPDSGEADVTFDGPKALPAPPGFLWKQGAETRAEYRNCDESSRYAEVLALAKRSR